MTVARASCVSLQLVVLGKGRAGVPGPGQVCWRPGASGLCFGAVVVVSARSALGILVPMVGRCGEHPSGACGVGGLTASGRVGVREGGAFLRRGVGTPSLGQLGLGFGQRTPHFLARGAAGLWRRHGDRRGRLPFWSGGPRPQALAGCHPFGHAGPGVVLGPRRRPRSGGQGRLRRAALHTHFCALLNVQRLGGEGFALRMRMCLDPGGFGVLGQGLLPRKARPSLRAFP